MKVSIVYLRGAVPCGTRAQTQCSVAPILPVYDSPTLVIARVLVISPCCADLKTGTETHSRRVPSWPPNTNSWPPCSAAASRDRAQPSPGAARHIRFCPFKPVGCARVGKCVRNCSLGRVCGVVSSHHAERNKARYVRWRAVVISVCGSLASSPACLRARARPCC